MSELSKIVKNYFKDKDTSIEEIVREIDKLKIDVVKEYLNDSENDNLYVIKRSGNLEKFNPDKITRSIKNAADSNKQQINTSDIEILMQDVDKSMKELNRKVFRTDEIKEFVKKALKEEGYSQIYDSYVSYIQI